MNLDANVLVVEDEAKLVEILQRTLSESFQVTVFTTYEELAALLEGSSIRFDLFVLDRMLDGKDSLNLIAPLKEKFPQIKVLVLSAISTPSEKAVALDLGADDYLSKPFANEELLARLRVLAKRIPSELRFGNIALDMLERTAKVAEVDLQLATKEFLLLRAFMKTPGKVYPKTTLYEEVWQTSADVESNAIETTVNKLRRKLEEAGASATIKNSRNLGYWIEE